MSIEIAGMGFVLVILSLITILAVVGIWQGMKITQLRTTSKVEIARDEAYRKLAENAIAVQKKMAEDLQQMAEDLSIMRERTASMEKMLREVE